MSGRVRRRTLVKFASIAWLVAVSHFSLFVRADDQAQWSSLISVADLQERLARPNLLIIDVRSPEDYARGQ